MRISLFSFKTIRSIHDKELVLKIRYGLSKTTYAYQWRDYDPVITRFNKIDRFA